MSERWQVELTKLHGIDPPGDLWDRVLQGPRLEPPPDPRRPRVVAAVVALALFAGAAFVAVRAFRPAAGTPGGLGGPSVLRVPPRGEVNPAFLRDGRPVFVVHHEDGSVSVVDAFSPHRAWGFEELTAWCPSTREFVEWGHEAHFDEFGTWVRAGPAPSSLATFAFAVVERGPDGDPASIRVGAMLAPDAARSAPVTAPTRPPFCPGTGGGSTPIVTHSLRDGQIWTSPAGAAAAEPAGWIAVRGTLLVARDGFVRLCARVDAGRCVGGAVVRGIDGVGLLVNVLLKTPGTAYRQPGVWLLRVRDGVLDDPAIAGFLSVR